MLLCGILPMTAFAEQADTDISAENENGAVISNEDDPDLAGTGAEADAADVSAEAELTEAGVLRHYVSSAEELREVLMINDTSSVHEIVLEKTIYAYVGAMNVHGDSNYVPVWCTLGKGQKTEGAFVFAVHSG